MTLAEIEDLVVKSQAAGFSTVEHQTETGFLRIRLISAAGSKAGAPSNASLVPGETGLPVLAPCPGIFTSSHPMQAAGPAQAGAAVAPGEAVAFLRIGPCLRAVVVQHTGLIGKARVAENTLVGYGEVLFEMTLC